MIDINKLNEIFPLYSNPSFPQFRKRSITPGTDMKSDVINELMEEIEYDLNNLKIWSDRDKGSILKLKTKNY